MRYIYRQTGTPLADDHDQPLERDKEGMKELVDRYDHDQKSCLSFSGLSFRGFQGCVWPLEVPVNRELL